MASNTLGGSTIPPSLDPARVTQLATELMKCVKKDQLVKAKFLMKGLRREDKRRIVSQV